MIDWLPFIFQSEDKNMSLLRDKTDVQSQLEENEEDMADIMKKYKAVVQQVCILHFFIIVICLCEKENKNADL